MERTGNSAGANNGHLKNINEFILIAYPKIGIDEPSKYSYAWPPAKAG